MIQKTFREYYLVTALSCFAHGIIAAMYVSYLIAHGLDLFQVGLVNCVFFTTIFVAEIPTGAFADVFGRKASYVVSCFVYGIGMFIYSISSSFHGFVCAEAVSAVAYTFASGACRAWFVDRLKHHGYTGELSKLFVRGDQIGCVMGVTSSIIGARIADTFMVVPWVVGGIVFVVCGIAALYMKEEYFVKQKFSFIDGLKAMKQTAQASIRYGFEDKRVRFILILIMTQVFVVQAPNMQWQPFFKEWLPSQTSMGFIFAGIQISFAVGSTMAPRILRRVKNEKKLLLVFQIWTGMFLVGAALVNQFNLAIGAFLLHELARGGFRPISSAYLHDNIPSKERATIESFVSMFDHLSGAVGLIATGFVAKMCGISATWIGFGLLLIFAALLVSKNGKK